MDKLCASMSSNVKLRIPGCGILFVKDGTLLLNGARSRSLLTLLNLSAQYKLNKGWLYVYRSKKQNVSVFINNGDNTITVFRNGEFYGAAPATFETLSHNELIVKSGNFNLRVA